MEAVQVIVILGIINGYKMLNDQFKLIYGDLDDVLSKHNLGFYGHA